MNSKAILTLVALAASANAYATGTTTTGSTMTGAGGVTTGSGNTSTTQSPDSNAGTVPRERGSNVDYTNRLPSGDTNNTARMPKMGGAPAQSGNAETGAASDTANSPELSPKEVCERIVKLDLSKKELRGQIEKWVHGHKPANLAKMGTDKINMIRQELRNTECQSDTVAGDHAFVVAKSGDRERLLPFVKKDGLWKVDAPVYRALYQGEARVPAGK